MIQKGVIFQHIQGNNVISIISTFKKQDWGRKTNSWKLQFDLEGEAFILQSLDGSGGSGSDFSMCTI